SPVISALASDPILIPPVEPVGVRGEHSEVAIRYVPAVEIRRRRRYADVGVGRMAVLSLVTFLAGSSGLAGTVLCLPGLFRFKAPEAPGRLTGLTLELGEQIGVLNVRRIGRRLGVAL